MNPAAEGTQYPEVEFRVEADRVEGFRRLFGTPGGVPPTFATAAEFAVIPTVVGDPALDLDFTRVLHGSQEYEVRRPLVEGERLRVRCRIVSIRQRAGSGFLTLETEMVGDDDGVAVVARSTMIERGPV